MASLPRTKFFAEQLAQRYHENAVRAEGECKDRPVRITGEVKSIGIGLGGTPLLVLNGYGNGGGIDIQVVFKASEAPMIAQTSKGTTITAAGVCLGLIASSVVVSDATMVPETPSL